MKRALLVGFIASLVISVSCKKEDSVDTVGVNNPVPDDYNNYYNPGDTTTANNNNSSENPNTVPCIPGDLSKNVIAFYPFSYGSYNDVSGLGNHLDPSPTSSASLAIDRSGNDVCALRFTPALNDNLITKSADFLENLESFSISLWFMVEDSTNIGNETLISTRAGYQCPEGNGMWSVFLNDCKRVTVFRNSRIWENDLGMGCQEFANAEAYHWKYLVALYDGGQNKLSLYIDGTLQGTVQEPVSCEEGVSEQNFTFFTLGGGFDGLMDDVIIFNKALSDSEINSLYQMEGCCAE
jgi:hypothetical protein